MSRLYLVTCGAGFLGINLCRHLLGLGHRIRTLDIAGFDYPERDRIDVIDGDVRDPEAVKRSLVGVDIVVHAAAALPLAPKREILSTGIQGTRCIAEHALSAGVDRFIFTSSTAVYGIPDHHPIVESDPLRGVGHYGESKIGAEALCREVRTKGLCISILRPKTFVGPERLGAFELLYEWAYSGHHFPLLGNGENQYQLLDVEDLCAAIELCATRPRDAVNDVFNVGAKSFGTMRQNVQAVLDRAGHGRHTVRLPAKSSILLLRMLSALRLSPLYPWIYDTAAKDSFVSIDKIGNALGFSPRYSSVDALLRNYDWYLAHRNELTIATGVTHRVPWKKGVLSIARAFF